MGGMAKLSDGLTAPAPTAASLLNVGDVIEVDGFRWLLCHAYRADTTVTLTLWPDASSPPDHQQTVRRFGARALLRRFQTATDEGHCPTCGRRTDRSEGWSTGQCDDCYLDDTDNDDDEGVW